MSEIRVSGDNIEAFIDNVIEKAKEGYIRVDTMELTMAVQTNYWTMTMCKEEVVEQEPVEKKAGRPKKEA